MSAEDLACCLKCQMTFTTYEELFVHSCIYIKVETNDFEESTALDFSNERDFKHDIVQSNSSEVDSDYSPKKKKCKQKKISKRNSEEENVDTFQENGRKKRKWQRKGKPVVKKLEYEFDEKHDILEEKKKDNLCDSMNLDLTEEFIILILQQVDELCENITNGDPDDQRTLEVNQNLNNAVSCYRTKLDEKSDPFGKTKVKEQKHSAKIRKNSKDDSIKVDRKFKKESKNENPTKDIKSDNHTPKAKVKVPKPIPTKDYSYCLELMQKATDNPKNEQLEFKTETLFEFMDLRENDILHCSLCNYSRPLKDKSNMFRHLKLVHKNEIKAKSEEGIDSDSIEQKFDCEKGICLKLYGPFHRKLWCLKCTEARVEVTSIVYYKC